MKSRLIRRSEEELLRTHPVRGSVPGWFFRVDEVSNNAWVVEGVDCWGRTVSVKGVDPDGLLAEAEATARQIRESPER